MRKLIFIFAGILSCAILLAYYICTSDFDDDGLSHLTEWKHGTNPRNKDSDGDRIPDAIEVADKRLNPLTPDDPNADLDKDGISNPNEIIAGTDPTKFDTDNDGLDDGYESKYSFMNPKVRDNTNTNDHDKDGMSDLYEGIYSLCQEVDDGKLDPDQDGLTNLMEFRFQSSPVEADIDSDGLNDLQEREAGTDPWKWDTDDDQLPDAWEIKYGLNPKKNQNSKTDTDGDGLTDLQEVHEGSDPNKPDTDGDGTPDGTEEANGTDPTDKDWGGTIPAAPSNLVETHNPDGSITYTWEDNSNNEDGFTIYSILPDGTEVFVAEVPANTTSYTYKPNSSTNKPSISVKNK